MKKAFTLIELLVVIAIIAILAGVIFVNLNSARKRARDVQVKSDMSELSKALEVYKVDNDLRPIGWGDLTDSSDDNDRNIAEWTDIDGSRLVITLPKNPNRDATLDDRYQITIIDTSSYAILGRLSTSDSTYWCIHNGSSKQVTGNLWVAEDKCDD